MTEQHPIVPPKKIVQEWISRWLDGDISEPYPDWFAARSAQWGADQEFEACVEYLVRCAQWEPEDVEELRAARRPKPQPELTDEQLIVSAEQAGLCYPKCWDLRGQDSPRLHHLRGFASAIAAKLRGQGGSNG